MNEMLKTASDHLLKIAEDLDKEAAKCTVFACESCSHTASLHEINSAIEESLRTASIDGSFEVEPVTVNDRVACTMCKSAMAYKPSELSERFYIEASTKDSAMYKTGPVEEVLEVDEADGETVDLIEDKSEVQEDLEQENLEQENLEQEDLEQEDLEQEDLEQEEAVAKKTASQAGINLETLGKYLSFGK